MLDPLVLNFHEFDAISRIHDLSISVSNNKIRSQDLVIISNSSRSYPNNGKEKFTPIQFISRSSNKETRPRIPSLFRKTYLSYEKKHQRATDVALQSGPYPVVFFPREI